MKDIAKHLKPGRVILAGGSGFLGGSLSRHLAARGYAVTILSRQPERYRGPCRVLGWDGRTAHESWASELEGATALINLAGKSVNCRPSASNRDAILQSRTEPMVALGDAVRWCYRPPLVWVQATSLAIYGDAGDRVCDEAAFVPNEYPADVCLAWEEALGRAIRPEMRWAALRLGWVLGQEGGVLPTLAQLARLGVGGRIGSGKQWISWIHETDMNRLFSTVIENPQFVGIFNATGIQPVTNEEFMSALRQVLLRRVGIPCPESLLRLAAPIIQVDPDLALRGRRALPCQAVAKGFHFRYQQLSQALEQLFAQNGGISHPANQTAGCLTRL